MDHKLDALGSEDERIERLQQLLAVPSGAMLATRAKARADLGALFAGNLESEIEAAAESWWTEETQAALRAMVQRLAAKASRR